MSQPHGVDAAIVSYSKGNNNVILRILFDSLQPTKNTEDGDIHTTSNITNIFICTTSSFIFFCLTTDTSNTSNKSSSSSQQSAVSSNTAVRPPQYSKPKSH